MLRCPGFGPGNGSGLAGPSRNQNPTPKNLKERT